MASEILPYQSSWQAWRCFTHHSLRMCRKRTGGIRRRQHLRCFLNWSFSPNPPHGYCLSCQQVLKQPILSLLMILPSITHQEVRTGHNVGLIKNTLVCSYCHKRYSVRQQSEHKKRPWGCCLLLGHIQAAAGADVWILSIGR